MVRVWFVPVALGGGTVFARKRVALTWLRSDHDCTGGAGDVDGQLEEGREHGGEATDKQRDGEDEVEAIYVFDAAAGKGGGEARAWLEDKRVRRAGQRLLFRHNTQGIWILIVRMDVQSFTACQLYGYKIFLKKFDKID